MAEEITLLGLGLDFQRLEQGARDSTTIINRLESKLDDLVRQIAATNQAITLDGAKKGVTSLVNIEQITVELSGKSQTLTKSVDGLGNAYKKAAASAEAGTGKLASGFNSLIGLAKQAAGGLGSIASGALSVLGGNLLTSGLAGIGSAFASTIENGIKFNDTMARARIQLRTLLGEKADVEGFIKSLQKISDDTEFQFPQLLTLATQLRTAKFEAKDIPGILKAVGDAVAYIGGGSEGLDRILLAIRQIKGNQRVSGEDLNRLLDANVPVFDIIQKRTGLRSDQFRKLAENNQINANTFVKYIIEGFQEQFGGGQQKIADSTVGVLFDTLTDVAERRAGEATKSLTETTRKVLSGAIDALNSSTSTGLADSVNSLSGSILSPLNRFIDGLRTGNFAEAGKGLAKDVIGGVTSYVSEKAGEVAESGKTLGEKLLKGAKDFLGIKSPSTEFYEVGRNANLGLALGIEDNQSLISEALNKAIEGALQDGKKKLRQYGPQTQSIFDQVDSSELPDDQKSLLKKIIGNRSNVFDTKGGSITGAGISSGDSVIDAIIQQAAEQHQVNVKLLQALTFFESSFNPNAQSPTGPRGLGQQAKATAERFGLDINLPGRKGYDPKKATIDERLDPAKSADAAARYIAFLNELFGNLDLVLAGYNQGEGAVKKAGNKIPDKAEARTYVDGINSLLNFINSLADGIDKNALNGVIQLGNLGGVNVGQRVSPGDTIYGGEASVDINERKFDDVALNLTKLTVTLDDKKVKAAREELAKLDDEFRQLTGQKPRTAAQQRADRQALQKPPEDFREVLGTNLKKSINEATVTILTDVTKIREAFVGVINSIVQTIVQRLAQKFTDQLFNKILDPLLDKIFGSASSAAGGGGGGLIGKVSDWLGNIIGGLFGKRAAGGPVTAGQTYLVGEQGLERYLNLDSLTVGAGGPQLFTAPANGYILPSNQRNNPNAIRSAALRVAPARSAGLTGRGTAPVYAGVPTGGGQTNNFHVTMNINGVQDARGFDRSRAQIERGLVEAFTDAQRYN